MCWCRKDIDFFHFYDYSVECWNCSVYFSSYCYVHESSVSKWGDNFKSSA